MAQQPKVTESLQKHLESVNPTTNVNVGVQLAAKATVKQFLLETKAMGVTIDEILNFPAAQPATVFIKATPAQVLQLQSSALVDKLGSNEPIPGWA
jgi:hypothetical protein